MRNVIQLRAEPPRADRAREFDVDECYSEALVETFIEEFTRPGDLVFDPFAGAGTTLLVAERMGRRALGVEILPARVKYVEARLKDPTAIIHGDSRKLDTLDLPPVDLCMCSPPYMEIANHPWNPLSGYLTMDGEYQAYLALLRDAFAFVGRLLTPDGKIVINVANLHIEGQSTPLAWDVAATVSTALDFQREVIIDWDTPPDWMTNDYCLIYGPQPTRPPKQPASPRAGR